MSVKLTGKASRFSLSRFPRWGQSQAATPSYRVTVWLVEEPHPRDTRPHYVWGMGAGNRPVPKMGLSTASSSQNPSVTSIFLSVSKWARGFKSLGTDFCHFLRKSPKGDLASHFEFSHLWYILVPGGKFSFKAQLHLYALTIFMFISTDNIFHFKDEENSSMKTHPKRWWMPRSPNQSVMELGFQLGLSSSLCKVCVHWPWAQGRIWRHRKMCFLHLGRWPQIMTRGSGPLQSWHGSAPVAWPCPHPHRTHSLVSEERLGWFRLWERQ